MVPTLEMSELNQPRPSNSHTADGETPFLSEALSVQKGIDQLNANIQQISTLRLHSLNALDREAENDITRLEQLTNETRTLSLQLKDKIKELESSSLQGNAQIRHNRIGFLRSKFLESIQNYQRVEQEGRVKVRQRVERQVRIANPDASPEEVNAIVDSGGQQIFVEMLTNSTRYAESRGAYREVQQRHQDLQQMERTLADLAQLFIDMGTMIQQHDPIIDQVQNTASGVQGDTEKGLGAVNQAVIHAISARKKKWICFFIFFFCCAVVAIALGIKFRPK